MLGINKTEYGGQIVGKGLSRVFELADNVVQIGPGGAPHEKVSTWLNLGFGLLAPELAIKFFPAKRELMEAAGGNAFSNIVDYTEDYIDQLVGPTKISKASSSQPGSGPVRDTRNYQVNKGYVQNMANAGQQGVSIKAPMKNGGRYTV
uniref:Uncharacterized protein n=1 Tax=viral metagenome TaxID=1070528 RepID=A0A6M3LXG6_9ZZZZ